MSGAGGWYDLERGGLRTPRRAPGAGPPRRPPPPAAPHGSPTAAPRPVRPPPPAPAGPAPVPPPRPRRSHRCGAHRARGRAQEPAVCRRPSPIRRPTARRRRRCRRSGSRITPPADRSPAVTTRSPAPRSAWTRGGACRVPRWWAMSASPYGAAAVGASRRSRTSLSALRPEQPARCPDPHRAPQAPHLPAPYGRSPGRCPVTGTDALL